MGKGGRVFLRGITSESYGLREFRHRQLAAPRVRDDSVVVDDAKVGHSGDSAQSRTWWRVGPGDDPFLTQSLQVHFVELPPPCRPAPPRLLTPRTSAESRQRRP